MPNLISGEGYGYHEIEQVIIDFFNEINNMNNILYNLEKLKLRKVIKCTTGGGVGSILKMELENNCYFFFYCTWRIEQNDVVLATSDDSSEALVGRMAMAAKALVYSSILSISITKQFDLIINLDNLCLRIFCNISYSQTENGGTYDTNWELCIPEDNLVLTINNHFKIISSNYY